MGETLAERRARTKRQAKPRKPKAAPKPPADTPETAPSADTIGSPERRRLAYRCFNGEHPTRMGGDP